MTFPISTKLFTSRWQNIARTPNSTIMKMQYIPLLQPWPPSGHDLTIFVQQLKTLRHLWLFRLAKTSREAGWWVGRHLLGCIPVGKRIIPAQVRIRSITTEYKIQSSSEQCDFENNSNLRDPHFSFLSSLSHPDFSSCILLSRTCTYLCRQYHPARAAKRTKSVLNIALYCTPGSWSSQSCKIYSYGRVMVSS